MNKKITAIHSDDVPLRKKLSNYPEPFASRMAGRQRQQLGEVFGLSHFGVNLTRIRPGGQSSLLHAHSKQEEFIFILEGEAILLTEAGETVLTPGMCAGFPANGAAHCLMNKTDHDVLYLEVGDRTKDDEVIYPADDLAAKMGPDGQWVFTHKDGRSY